MNQRFIMHGGCILLLSLCILPANYTNNPKVDDVFEKSIYHWTKTQAEVYHLVHKKYYQLIDPQGPIIEGLKAFAKSLDPHCIFFDPKGYKEILATTQGEFPGIGIQVDHTKDPDDEFLRVVDTVPGGPAFKVGVLAEDRIIAIDDYPVKGLGLEEIIARLKGERYSKVTIKVQRAGSPTLLEFTIVRDIIQEQNALCFYFKDHDVYYLLLTLFTENAIKQMEQLLKKVQSSKGFILDLRNNSGGLLNSVIDIAGFFMEKNSLLVTTVDRNNQVMERYATAKTPIANKSTPIFILVNNYTASAAEILAGALQIYAQEHNLAIFIVGSKTFGKGSVQEVIPLSNDCAISLTIALYALSNNTFIQGIGITPDFQIDPLVTLPKDAAWFNATFGRESALRNAIQLNGTPQEQSKKKPKENDTEKSWYERKREMIANDYLIISATRLIEMLDLGKKAHASALTKRKDMVQFLTQRFSPRSIQTLEEIKI